MRLFDFLVMKAGKLMVQIDWDKIFPNRHYGPKTAIGCDLVTAAGAAVIRKSKPCGQVEPDVHRPDAVRLRWYLGPEHVKRAVEVAASGAHNLLRLWTTTTIVYFASAGMSGSTGQPVPVEVYPRPTA